MSDEKYYFDVGEEGQQGLDILDYLFNSTTQKFIIDAGLKSGMKVLDIGCGLGTMSVWLAQQVGPNGSVTAIDNNEFQIKATLKKVSENNLKNVNAVCLSAYDIDSLNETFDFIYCRFILHHINRPTDVIRSVYNILNKDGTFVAEEGLVSQAFIYPFSNAWGNERWHNDTKGHDTEGKTRDGNFGMKLYYAMHTTGFKDLAANLIQPVITSSADRNFFITNMLNCMNEEKRSFLAEGLSESEWEDRCNNIKKLAADDAAMIAFYQSCQVSGIRSN